MEFYEDEEFERAKLYKLFSPLFMQEPTDEILVQVRDIFETKFNDTSDEIRMDFVYLFSDAAGHLPPYESLYNYAIWDGAKLWGKATEEVQKSYSRAGLVLDEEIELIPDHLSVELLFMSYLIERGLREHQKNFLQEHLSLWIPGYCDDIREHAQTAFYQSVAALLKEDILIDCEEFGIEAKQ